MNSALNWIQMNHKTNSLNNKRTSDINIPPACVMCTHATFHSTEIPCLGAITINSMLHVTLGCQWPGQSTTNVRKFLLRIVLYSGRLSI